VQAGFSLGGHCDYYGWDFPNAYPNLIHQKSKNSKKYFLHYRKHGYTKFKIESQEN